MAQTCNSGAGLTRAITRCTVCPGLAPHDKFQAAASGSRTARALIVGEAPGAGSIAHSLHWSGRGGRLLRREIRALGYELEDVFYLTNVVKCRPPDNRDPRPTERTACRHFLDDEIALVRPALIITFGRFAAEYFLGPGVAMAEVHGKRRHLPGGATLVTLYHPANINLHEDVATYKQRVRRVFREALRVAGRPVIS